MSTSCLADKMGVLLLAILGQEGRQRGSGGTGRGKRGDGRGEERELLMVVAPGVEIAKDGQRRAAAKTHVIPTQAT